MSNTPAHRDIARFHEKLKNSKKILALCGAGLSASSGLPTFRGAGGLWRNHKAQDLATPGAFEESPGLVWLFYGYRRHMALKASPNAGHYALAELARKKPDSFLCLTQNVDGLAQRAHHPAEQLRTLHGSLFDIKCSRRSCDWTERDNYADPFCPALAPASEDVDPGRTLPLLDPAREPARVGPEALPRCPRCAGGLQRPAVVWFGECLDGGMLRGIDGWLDAGPPVDLVLSVGTSALVHPAAGYIHRAARRGAAVAHVNLEAERAENLAALGEGDFAFARDAAEILPVLLEPVIGKLRGEGEFGAPVSE